MATATKSVAKNSQLLAIVWDPEKDSSVMKPPEGSRSDRPFMASWTKKEERERAARLDKEAIEAGRGRILGTLSLSSVHLEPGLNWISGDLWAAALENSRAHGEKLGLEGTIQRLLGEGAIQTFPAPSAQKSIAGFGIKSAAKIIEGMRSTKILEEWLLEDEVRGQKALRVAIEERINALSAHERRSRG